MKPYIFMSGQMTSVLQLCLSKSWGFTQQSRKIERKGSGFICGTMPQIWKGGIYYASDPDIVVAKNNLEILRDFPCWPDPSKLLRLIDRQQVAVECIREGFFENDPCTVLQWDDSMVAIEDTVVKFGNQHSGIDKMLVKKGDSLPRWEGRATIQPLFEGRSVRILHVGSAIYFIETTHPDSWIKNSPGGEESRFEHTLIPTKMMHHSFKVRDFLDLEVVGNDYILSDDGSYHFLETNQFPGLNPDVTGNEPVDFLLERMRSLEEIAGGQLGARNELHPA